MKFTDIDTFSENAAKQGKIVIVAALDGTFQRKPFGKVLNLVPLSETVIKLSAVCVLCQDDAAFSVRLSNETAVEVIGGADKYIAVCRTCYGETTSGQVDQEKLANILRSLEPTTSTQPLTHQHRVHLPTDPTSHAH
jgi:thymidine kinase